MDVKKVLDDLQDNCTALYLEFGATDEVIEDAVRVGSDMLVTHHIPYCLLLRG